MSRFFPQAAYVEDQQHAHTLLTAHVLYRGFQTGAVLGLTLTPLKNLFVQKANKSSLLRATGLWSSAFTILMVPALLGRMHGREEIEWKDRAWRLLANKGQVEVDDFSVPTTVAGVAVGVVRGGGMMRVLGSTGVGSVVGVVAYMGWRYGVKGGKWEEKR